MIMRFLLKKSCMKINNKLELLMYNYIIMTIFITTFKLKDRRGKNDHIL